MTKPEFNRSMVKAIIHHVARRFATEPEKLGAVKLHKILWHAEIQFLRRDYKRSGETFVKNQFGPCSIHLDELVSELVAERHLTVVKPSEDYEATIFVGKGHPDPSTLNADQWRVVDQVAEHIVNDHTAGSISERSHGPIWEAVDLYEEMPAGAAAVQWMAPTEADKSRMRERLGH